MSVTGNCTVVCVSTEVVPDDEAKIAEQAEQYQPPAIVWSEPYEPVGFGMSCAKVENRPNCYPGPNSG